MSVQQEQEIQNHKDQDEENSYKPEESSKEVLIRLSDMEPQDECVIVSIANSAIGQVADLGGVPEAQKYSKMAGIIKRELDDRLGSGWYVMCGKNFGSYVTHELGTFMHFCFEDLHVCCFKAR